MAAHVIQDAVDAAVPSDEIVVTNGVYAAGWRTAGTNILVNRVAVNKPLVLRSVNGPQFTVIQGYQVPGRTNGDSAIRCAYLAAGATLSGFTLTRGATRDPWVDSQVEASGGGVWCESTNSRISNCVVSGNAAGYGGGAYSGTVDEGTCYVSQDSVNPAPPYTSWATAATNIQDAVDAAAMGGTVLITNGVYATGGRAVYATMTNRIAVTKPVALRSVKAERGQSMRLSYCIDALKKV